MPLFVALNDPPVAPLDVEPATEARVGAELAGDNPDVALVVTLDDGAATEGAVAPTADPAPTTPGGIGFGAVRFAEL